jgi:hypothetical protein
MAIESGISQRKGTIKLNGMLFLIDCVTGKLE